MTVICPRCHGELVVVRRQVQKSAAATGVVVGAVQGASTALTRIKTGGKKTTGRLKISVITAAILGGLIGAAAGCSAGSAIGETLEQAITNNYRCKACGHVFGLTPG